MSLCQDVPCPEQTWNSIWAPKRALAFVRALLCFHASFQKDVCMDRQRGTNQYCSYKVPDFFLVSVI